MRYSDQSYSIDAALRKGRQLPQWYLDEPYLQVGDQFYLNSFRDLNTCRNAQGVVPWTVIQEYAIRKGLDPSMVENFTEVMLEMDSEYLKWSKNKQETLDRQAKNK